MMYQKYSREIKTKNCSKDEIKRMTQPYREKAETPLVE